MNPSTPVHRSWPPPDGARGVRGLGTLRATDRAARPPLLRVRARPPDARRFATKVIIKSILAFAVSTSLCRVISASLTSCTLAILNP